MQASFADYQIDLEAYFDKLGYTGPREASLHTLQTLQYLHQEAIAFENLDPFLDRPVSLALSDLEDKLVFNGRGGYCYEQNLLFAHVLQRLGFVVSHLFARVLWGLEPSAQAPLSHMLLHVRLAHRPYIVDVGFGGNSPVTPLLVNREAIQHTSHGTYRNVLIDGEYWLQCLVGEQWRNMYRYELTRYRPIDYVAANFYTSTHDDSHFRHGLYASRVFAGGRYQLRNQQLTTRYRDGREEQLQLRDAAHAEAMLDQYFGIRIPDSKAFGERWRQLVRGLEVGSRPLVGESVERVA